MSQLNQELFLKEAFPVRTSPARVPKAAAFADFAEDLTPRELVTTLKLNRPRHRIMVMNGETGQEGQMDGNGPYY